MDKLLEMIGANKLDEAKQVQIKEKLETLIDLKSKEIITEKLKEEKDKLIEEYEGKFETYKEDMTSKFSNFIDEIIDEQMQIPEKVLEFARKGELYSDLIEQFKVRLGVDEGLLDEEVKALLKEAKKEITSLRTQLDEKIKKELEAKGDAQELAAELYIRQKCDGLTSEQSKHVIQMLEGIKDKEDIDKKFSIIVEAYKESDDSEDDSEDDGDDKKKKKKKKGDKEDMEDKDEDMDESKKGKGNIDGDDLNEDKDENKVKTLFEHEMDRYIKVLKTNKI